MAGGAVQWMDTHFFADGVGIGLVFAVLPHYCFYVGFNAWVG